MFAHQVWACRKWVFEDVLGSEVVRCDDIKWRYELHDHKVKSGGRTASNGDEYKVRLNIGKATRIFVQKFDLRFKNLLPNHK